MPALGILCKLYYNTASYGSPTWTVIALVGDLQVKGEWDKADALTRETFVKRMLKTLLGMGFSGKIRKDLTDTAYAALRAAYYSHTSTLDFLVLDGPNNTNGVEGYRFDAQITKWSQDQSPGVGQLFQEFDAEPCVSANLPQSVLVTGGVPVYVPCTPGT